MNSAAFLSRRRRIAHALANHSNLSLRVDVDVVLVLALIQRSRRSPRSFASTRARAVLRLDAKRSSLGVVRSPIAIRRDRIRRRDRLGTEPTSNRTDVEPNRTEPNATDPRRRCLPFARATDARIIHSSIHSRIFAFMRRRERPGAGRIVHQFASDRRVVCCIRHVES